MGSAEAETIEGRDGDDYLAGAGGDDTLKGGDGDDIISPGSGNDHIDGGPAPIPSGCAGFQALKIRRPVTG